MRKKTYEEKALSGTLKLEKVREATLTTVQKPPKPEKYLSNNAKKIFRRICSHIIEHNILCDIDSLTLSMLAHNFDIYEEMARAIEEKNKKKPGSGYIKTYSSGATAKSDELIVMDAASNKIQTFAKEFGLTVKSRDGILAFAKAAVEDESEGDELDLI